MLISKTVLSKTKPLAKKQEQPSSLSKITNKRFQQNSFDEKSSNKKAEKIMKKSGCLLL